MKETVVDRGESVGLMEPLLSSDSAKHVFGLSDFAVDLAGKAAGLRRSLPEGVAGSLANLVRAMNCYYSNLIEGHDTHPVDIERALRGDYSTDPKKRNLQLEAKAHIAVQTWIDDGGVDGFALTAAGLRQIHRRFCDQVPGSLRRLTDPRTGEEIRDHSGGDPYAGRTGGPACSRQPGRDPAIPGPVRKRLLELGQDRRDSGCRDRPSPLTVDPPVSGWQRPGRAIDVPCRFAGNTGHRWRLVGGKRPGS